MRQPGLDLNLSLEGICTRLINWASECYTHSKTTLTFLLDNCAAPPWHCWVYHSQDYRVRGGNSQWQMIYALRTHLSLYHSKRQRSAKKIFFHVRCCRSLTLWLAPPIKGAIYDGEPRSPGEFYVRGSLISLSYLNLALLKGILTTVNLGPSDFMAFQ